VPVAGRSGEVIGDELADKSVGTVPVDRADEQFAA
jgi:hypothetical protein